MRIIFQRTFKDLMTSLRLIKSYNLSAKVNLLEVQNIISYAEMSLLREKDLIELKNCYSLC